MKGKSLNFTKMKKTSLIQKRKNQFTTQQGLILAILSTKTSINLYHISDKEQLNIPIKLRPKMTKIINNY